MDREISQEELRRRRKKLYIKIGCGVLLVASLFVGPLMIGDRSVKGSDLTFTEADKGTLEASMTASGRVVPAFEQTITSPIESRIVEVYARAGDSLDAGTPLLLLDLQDAENELKTLGDRRRMKQLEIEQSRINNGTRVSNLEMQLKVKEMTVERLKADVENERRLDSLGSGTGEKVRQAELAYRTGVLEMEQLRKQLDGERSVNDAAMNVSALDLSVFENEISTKQRTLDDARLQSPRAATLTFITDEIGKRVGAGEKLAVIADLKHFKVEGQISDSYAEHMTIGQRTVVAIGSERIEGTVSNVQPSSSDGVVTFSVRLNDESNPKLRPGLRADLYVMTDVKDEVVRIGRGPYYSGPGQYELWVMTADGKEIKKRRVRLGDANFQYVEVTEGINPGEKVVSNNFDEPTNTSTLKINK